MYASRAASATSTPEPTKESGRTTHKDVFEPYAARHDVPFPPTARITAYELLTFLPNSIQCPDVVYRFATNGASRKAVCAITNTARDLPKEWTSNQCGTAITKTMVRSGFDKWSLSVHDLFHAPMQDKWDETSLGIAGSIAPDALFKDVDARSIPFKDLALSVRRWPRGDDALDLTRMVGHCVDNPEETWMYPHDYVTLLTRLGGPAPAGHGHLDRQTFERWKDIIPPPPRVWSTEEEARAKAMLIAKREAKKIEKMKTQPRRTRRQSRSLSASQDSTEPHRPRRRRRKHAKLEHIDVKEPKLYKDVKEEEGADYRERYAQAAAKYVAPPAEAEAPDSLALAHAFAAAHAAGEKDLCSAYAFGGPRHEPPYRMLHDIQQPDQDDVSGWAENLRWAFEQRACFWHAVQTEAWNESPAHMEFIAQIRKKQLWASGELLRNFFGEEAEESDELSEELVYGAFGELDEVLEELHQDKHWEPDELCGEMIDADDGE
ncbi:hypothetical protein ACEQ8H_007235 [Pleosporales sp. CAS-2024a]